MAGCCSALYFLNLKGDVLIQRIYRDDVEYGPAGLSYQYSWYSRTA